MYCPRCQEEYSPFQSICPTCFGDLRPSAAKSSGTVEALLSVLDGAIEMPTSSLASLPTLDLSAPVLQDLSTTLLQSPAAEEVRSGGREAATRAREAALAAAASVGAALDSFEQGAPVGEAAVRARAELEEIVEATGRDLQRMANATREAVLRELKKEGVGARERAAGILRQRQAEIGQEMGARLEELGRRYGHLRDGMDPADRSILEHRLKTLKKQSSRVLVGLQKEVEPAGPGFRVPDPVREIVRQAGGDGERVLQQVESAVETGGESVESVKKGCLGAFAAFLNLFIWPGLGHFIVGRWGMGFLFLILPAMAQGALEGSGAEGLAQFAIRAVAAWTAWTAAWRR